MTVGNGDYGGCVALPRIGRREQPMYLNDHLQLVEKDLDELREQLKWLQDKLPLLRKELEQQNEQFGKQKPTQQEQLQEQLELLDDLQKALKEQLEQQEPLRVQLKAQQMKVPELKEQEEVPKHPLQRTNKLREQKKVLDGVPKELRQLQKRVREQQELLKRKQEALHEVQKQHEQELLTLQQQVFPVMPCNTYTACYVWIVLWLFIKEAPLSLNGQRVKLQLGTAGERDWENPVRVKPGSGQNGDIEQQGCIEGPVNMFCLSFVGCLDWAAPFGTLLLTVLFQLSLPILLSIKGYQDYNPFTCPASASTFLRYAKGVVATYILFWVLLRDCRVVYQMLLNVLRLRIESGNLRWRGGIAASVGCLLCFVYIGVICMVLWASLMLVAHSERVEDVILNGVSSLFILDIDDVFQAVEEKTVNKVWTPAIQACVTNRTVPYILRGRKMLFFLLTAWGFVAACLGAWVLAVVCIAR